MKRTKLLILGGLLLGALAGRANAQTVPHVTGTFKTPGNQTPSQAGLRQLATVGSTAVYGTADFVPYDSLDNVPARILCGGITYIPQPVHGWIAADGTLVDNVTGAAGVDLIPTVGCTPSGLVYRATIRFAASADNRIPATSFTEDKAMPSQSSVDWGSLAAAGVTAPSYTGYSTIQQSGSSLPARAILNFIGATCTDDPTDSRTNCDIAGGGSTEVEVNSVDTSTQSPINFVTGSKISFTNTSLGMIQAAIVALSIQNGDLAGSIDPAKITGTAEVLTHKNAVNGYAGLDSSSHITLAETPLTTNGDLLGMFGGILTRIPLPTSCSNASTSKLLFDTTSGFTCGTDQTGSGGSGITTLNTLTTTTQTFANSNDTNITLGITSTGSTHTFALGWTGLLAVARGGTGLNTLAAHQLYVGNGTSVPTAIAAGTNGQVLESAGGSADPAFQDPIVSGPDATGAAQTKNPVAGLAGIDYGTSCAGFPCVQEAKVDTGGNLYVLGTITAHIQGYNGSSWVNAGISPSDNSTFTAGTTFANPVGGWYSSSPTACTDGNVCVPSLSSDRKLFVLAYQGTASWAVGIADGANITLGAKADNKSTATDTTAVSVMAVLKEISAMEQAPPSRAVTNAGTFAVQAASTIVDGGDVTLGAKADNKSTATDTTAISLMQAIKEISFMEQNPASRAVTNAGTFAVQAAESGTWNLNNISGTISLPTGAALDASVTALEVAIASTTSGQKGILALCGVTTSPPTYTTAQTDPLSCNAAGGLRVDGSGVTQPVSNAGTFAVQAAESGTWNLNNISGTISLPTGAAQEAGGNLASIKTDVDKIPASPSVGGLGDNGSAATANRTPTLPGISESNYPSAETAGRDTSQRHDLEGNQLVSQMPEVSFASYHAAALVSSASSATDIAVITGQATNKVLITRIVVSCTQTTAGVNPIYIIKRSAADTSGTSSNMTSVPDYSSYSAASTTAKTYTVNPTPGAAVGQVDVEYVGCMASATASPNDVYVLNLAQKPIVLNGTAEQLAVNLNGATVTGGSFAVRFEWIETTGL